MNLTEYIAMGGEEMESLNEAHDNDFKRIKNEPKWCVPLQIKKTPLCFSNSPLSPLKDQIPFKNPRVCVGGHSPIPSDYFPSLSRPCLFRI